MAEDRAVVAASLGELKRVIERLDTTLSGLTHGREAGGSMGEDSLRRSIQRTEVEIALSKRRLEQARAERDLKIRYSQDTFSYMGGLMRSLYKITGSHSRKLFSLLKTFNIAQALMDTYTAFNRTLASVPYPFNLAAAAAVMAQGLARVQQIRATTPGGGGGSSRGAGGLASTGFLKAPQVVSAASGKLQPQITIQIQNPITGSEEEWERLAEERIAPAIKRVVDRNVEVI